MRAIPSAMVHGHQGVFLVWDRLGANIGKAVYSLLTYCTLIPSNNLEVGSQPVDHRSWSTRKTCKMLCC
jgi:hypothetical protein